MMFKGIKRKKMKGGEKRMGEKNGQWKGGLVGYTALHQWVRRRLPAPCSCFMCMEKVPDDLHNVDGKYTRDLSTWVHLCRKCHSNVHRDKKFRALFIKKINGL